MDIKPAREHEHHYIPPSVDEVATSSSTSNMEARCSDHLKTFNGKVYPTYHEACRLNDLLEDDNYSPTTME